MSSNNGNNTNNNNNNNNSSNDNSSSSGMYIHLLAGAVAGTTGAILTCPLEVVKTRFQASTSAYHRAVLAQMNQGSAMNHTSKRSFTTSQYHYPLRPPQPPPPPPPPPKATTAAAAPAISGGAKSSFVFRNAHVDKHHQHQLKERELFKKALAQKQQLQQPPKVVNMAVTTSKIESSTTTASTATARSHRLAIPGYRIYLHAKFIIKNEGLSALFKGLGPTIVGVAPYRAIYFYSYANAKEFLLAPNTPAFSEGQPLLHIASAYCAGFSAVTVTNPIWFIKTRLQLDETPGGTRVFDVIRKIYRERGVRGFYKGITASYFGVTETALYFTIYEQLKRVANSKTADADSFTFLTYFTSAGFSKSMAACLCYPHEVARTRLRQEGSKYTGFFQTLALVFREEGIRGLYKGMATHLVRQIPNTAIVMTTYELVVDWNQSGHALDDDGE